MPLVSPSSPATPRIRIPAAASPPLQVFNQNPNEAVNATLRVPLYYSGLSTVQRTGACGCARRPMRVRVSRVFCRAGSLSVCVVCGV
jgi:hypothetical protein